MPKQATITEEQKDEVVRLYEEGKKWSYIASEVNIHQSNIGWILSEKGVRKDRQRRPSEEITAAQALERALLSERNAAEWRVRYETEHALCERLLEELARLRARIVGDPDLVDPRRLHVATNDDGEIEE